MARRRIGAILFWSGLMISTAGFLIGQANRIPFILRLIAPSYVSAISGYAHLMSSGSLVDTELGFKEIAEIVLDAMAAATPQGDIRTIRILRFTCNPNTLKYTRYDGHEAVPVVPVMAHLSNGQQPEGDNKHIKESIDKLRENTLLRLALPVFILGSVIQILSRLVNTKPSPVSPPPEKSNNSPYDTGEQKNTDCKVW